MVDLASLSSLGETARATQKGARHSVRVARPVAQVVLLLKGEVDRRDCQWPRSQHDCHGTGTIFSNRMGNRIDKLTLSVTGAPSDRRIGTATRAG